MVDLEKGRPAKYIRQTKTSNSPEPLTVDRWKEFINNHKGPGKEQAIELWHFLLEKGKISGGGWVLYLDILEHMKIKFSMSNPRVDNLMKEMVKWHIVKKQKTIVPSEPTPNKNRVFYKICGDAITPVFTHLGMVNDYPRLYRENIELTNKLNFAISFIGIHELSEEYNAEMEKQKVSNERWKNMSRDEIVRKIRNETSEDHQDYKTRLEHDRIFYLQRDLEKLNGEKK